MITLKITSAITDADIRGALIICPHCLEDVFAYQKACMECGGDIYEANALISDGIESRFVYHRVGWPAMDRMARDRLKEKRN